MNPLSVYEMIVTYTLRCSTLMHGFPFPTSLPSRQSAMNSSSDQVRSGSELSRSDLVGEMVIDKVDLLYGRTEGVTAYV